MARTRNGSASFKDSEDGVSFEARLVNTYDGQALFEKIKTGLLGECSIGLDFSDDPEDGDWEMMNDVMTVNLKRASFGELSIVRTGAMRNTSVSTRTLSAFHKSASPPAGDSLEEIERRMRGMGIKPAPTGSSLEEIERRMHARGIKTAPRRMSVEECRREIDMLKAGIIPPRVRNLTS